jgi:diacylglycerol kinase
MFHIARDFAAFGSLVCFCTTLAVWGEVLLSAG